MEPLREMEELHHVATFEIVACNNATLHVMLSAIEELHCVATYEIAVCNVAEVEADPTSATLPVTISPCGRTNSGFNFVQHCILRPWLSY